MSKLSRDLVAKFQAQGVTLRLEPGKRHLKIYIGDTLAAVMSRGSKASGGLRGLRNIEASVRRVANKFKPKGQGDGR